MVVSQLAPLSNYSTNSYDGLRILLCLHWIVSGCKLVHFKLVPSFVESQMESILSSAETISLKLFNIFS